ncbi:MAG: amino acid adenylation domain-containing protein, partial [Bacteroidota bacterium]
QSGRLYRTGDLGRYLPDGQLEFFGRKDFQVKIRGHRIELGEIEEQLIQLPDVQECTVVVKQSKAGNKYLVAYVTVVPQSKADAAQIKQQLGNHIPAYMIPSPIVILDQLPLTAAGKVDRKALKAHQDNAEASKEQIVEPSTETEARLKKIWEEVLQIDNISVDSDFFQIGGHSLRAIRIQGRVQQEWQVKVAFHDFFLYPSIQSFANYLDGLQTEENVDIQALAAQVDYALSPAQRRLWVLNQFQDTRTAYNVSGSLRIEGDLQPAVLEKALWDLIDRHEILRTNFIQQDNEARQRIHKVEDFGFALKWIDLREEDDAQAVCQDQMEAQMNQAFDLEKDPLIRTSCWQLSEDAFILSFSLHHIVFDGWSLPILMRDLSALYNAALTNATAELPTLDVQYKDYAHWINERMAADGLANCRMYWLDKLSGELPQLELPLDHPRPAVQSFEGANAHLLLPTQLVEPLFAQAQKEQSNRFNTLVATVNALLYSLSRQTDIILATPLAGRDNLALENQVGFYTNTLVLRNQFEPTDDWTSLLRKVRQTTLDAFRHSDYPFDDLVEALGVKRDLSRSPIFDVWVQLAEQGNDTTSLFQLDGLTVADFPVENTVSKFDLAFFFEETKDGILLDLEYNTSLFEQHTIEALLTYYQQLILQLQASTATSLKDIRLLTAEQENELIALSSGTSEEYPTDSSIAALFAQQLARTPEAIALRCEDRAYTYKELDKLTNRIAHVLHLEYGIGQEAIIGLHMERSEWYVIGILSILKAGAAFLPIGTQLPVERIKYMTESTKTSLVLTVDKEWPTDLPSWDLSTESGRWKAASDEALPLQATAQDLAYVLFTSGTTGYPKGAMVEQAGVINHIFAKRDLLQLTEDSVIALTASISFDVAIWQALTALLFGGCTQVYKKDSILQPRKLLSALAEDGVQYLQVVPSYLAELLNLLESDESLTKQISLRCLVSAGEILRKELVERWFALCPDIPLLNAYGPTEASDIITHYLMESTPSTHSISIGRPLPNLRVYILDENDRLCPSGIKGEICVAGPCVSRGYIGQPELSAQVFAIDPHQKEEVRLYRTGDIGRHRPDGQIELVGRKDHQLKIRGQRVEIAEVEEQLARIEGVKSCAVVAVEQETETSLCAYIICKEGTSLTEAFIRTELAGWLSAYMIPEYICLLEQLPVTASGKIDRKALAQRPVEKQATETVFAEASTETEKALLDIWQQVLQVKNISTEDDFFRRGGNSLKAIRVQSEIYRRWQKEVAFPDFFRHPSIRQFAQFLDQQLAQSNQGIPKAAQADLYPMSPAQRRLWVLSQFEHNKTAYNLTQAFRLEGDFDKDAFFLSVAKLMERHESLRTCFVQQDGQLYQRILPLEQLGIPVDCRELFASNYPMSNCLDELEIESQYAFDLSKEAPIRFCLWKIRSDLHVMLFNIHHIATDAWSMKVLLEEWIQFYQAIVDEEALPSESLEIQYKDYASWINQRMLDGGLSKAANYWHQQLSGELPALELPTDRPRAVVRSFEGACERMPLDTAQIAALKNYSIERKTTLFSSLTALVNNLLFHLSGQEDIILGTTIAGRERPELQSQIGFYVNTLALRTRFSAQDSFDALLANVQQSVEGAFRHQDYPFDELVEALVPDRNSSRTPLFDVLVEHLGEELQLQPIALEGLSIEEIELGQSASKFDLSFRFIDELDTTVLYLEYNSNLFSEQTIKRWGSMLQNMLQTVLEDSKRPLVDFEWKQTQESRQLLQMGTPSVETEIVCANLKSAFEKQVAFTPDAAALLFDQESLTYQQLNNQANRIAHQLMAEIQTTKGEVVALLAERSPAFIAGLLAVAKSGASFLPIDPSLPEERIRFLLKDAGVQLVLTDTVHMFDLTLLYEGNIVLIDDSNVEAEETTVDNPTVVPEPFDTAYVLYTSGSTGQPKGVEVSQSNIMHYLQWANEYYFDGQAAHPMPLFTSVAFDLTMTCIFSSLLRGDSLRLYPESMAIEDILRDVFSPESGIKAVKMTPAHVQLLQLLDLSQTAVQKVILGGEAVVASQVDSLLVLNEDMHLYNEYGPTETTVGCTVDRLRKGQDITIGTPIDRMKIYILNAYGKLCPMGVSGEIYIGGAGVAKGYKNRPELTAERFVAHPFSDDPQARLYRSGDMGRWLPDGKLQYLGRRDQQVKVRGHRIELGEIEAALDQLVAIRQCAVLAIGEGIEKQLWAFTCLTEGQTSDQWKKELNRQLPTYMIPQQWTELTEMPLTNNGKIDRKALQKQAIRSVNRQEERAAADEIEAGLQDIWKDILSVDSVGMQESFFELGGHSLKAIQMTLAVQERLAHKLELQDVFNLKTIEALASQIRDSQSEEVQDIAPLAPQAHYALSDAQRRLWVLYQFEESRSAYNMHTTCRIKGDLDRDLLHFSLARLLDRHESLRTRFAMVDGEARQFIQDRDELDFDIAYADLRGHRGKLAKAEAQSIKFAQEPFDLETGPLMRLKLWQTDSEEYVLALVIHHIVSDGWSMEIITRELLQIYEALRVGRPNPLPVLDVQYKDFAAWQNQLLDGEQSPEHRQYWLDRFRGELPTLQLPTDFARPQIKTYDSGSVSFHWDEALSQQIRQLAIDQNSSVFNGIFAAITALMHRYSGQDDIILGTPVAGRDHHQLREQVGCFLNVLPIRASIDAKQSFQQLLQQTADRLLQAQNHQLYPFDRLVDELKLQRDTSRSPLFDVLIVSTDLDLTASSDKAEEDASLQIEPFVVDRAANKYDLTFYFYEEEGRIKGSLAYNRQLFEEARIQGMLTHLEGLLTTWLDAPTQAIGKAPILTAEEYRRLLVDFNDTVTPYDRQLGLHQLFEAQVDQRGRATALRHDGKSMSYQVLNKAANRLARHLLASGLQKEEQVGIRCERNFEMIIAMLAILKAGGSYVPIDPAYPDQRQLYIISNSNIRLVLTDEEISQTEVPQGIEALAICSEAYGKYETSNLDIACSGNEQAYTIYTSGSTGQPKGVAIAHHSVVNLVQWVNRRFEVGPTDRMLLLTSICFDLSVYDIFGLLAAGGSIVIADYDDIRDYKALQDLLTREDITLWDTVPTTLDYLLTELERYEPSYRQKHLRLIFNSGDWIPVQLPARSARFFPSSTFVSLGGATEATVWSNYYCVERGSTFGNSIPYGKPIANNFFYILDETGHPVPQGTAGELYIGGVGVATGYFNDPAKTAAAFVDDPFFPDQGGKMYRTGDLGRQLPDGNMEFLGRRDHQVKIRGFRVELGEIENRLNEHPAVRQALVATVGEDKANRRIAAYLIADDKDIAIDTLQALSQEGLQCV